MGQRRSKRPANDATAAPVEDPVRPSTDEAVRILSVVRSAATRIVSSDDWRSGVERMLAEIGTVAAASRVVLARNFMEASGQYGQEDLFEWDGPGIARILGDQAMPTLDIKDNAFQSWREARSRGEVMQGITRELPPEMRRWFEVLGVRSALRVPVFVRDEWWGTIGFDQCDRERVWGPLETESLRTAAALVGLSVEHHRSRDALSASEREAAAKAVSLQAVLDGVAQGVNAFDDDLTLRFANAQFLSMFDFPAELGRPGTPFEAMLRHRWRTGSVAAGSTATDEETYVAEQMARWRSLFARTPEARVEQRRSNGMVVDVWRRPLTGGGFVTTFTDMTAQIRMRDALLRDEERFRNIVEANPLPLMIIKLLSDRVLYANQRAADVLGYRLDELIGLRSQTLLDGQAVRERLLAALGDHYTIDGIEIRVRRSDDTTLPMEVTFRPVTFAGAACIVVGLYDLSERKKAEAQIARQRDALHQSEKLTALGSLLAGVAHELNNPLSVVVSQAALMQDTTTDPRTMQRAAKIQTAADRCARIVKSFLAIARQRPAARSMVRLRSLLRTALDLTSYGLSSSGIQVSLDVADDLPDIWADGDQLVQVFMNLLVNAQQVLQDVPEPRHLRIAARPDGADHVRVSVADNGPGIPQEMRSRIFEPFFTTKPVGSGTGMGLSLSLGMIGAHRGNITLEETPGGGASFVVRLPRGAPDDAIAETAPTTPAVRQKSILIVDDEPDIAEMLAEIVAPLATRVDVAGNGADALRQIDGNGYDLVISDLRMPELDGPGLFRTLSQRPGGFAGRILFVSGDTLGHSLESFLKESGCPFLDKPFTPAEVRRRVAEIMETAA